MWRHLEVKIFRYFSVRTTVYNEKIDLSDLVRLDSKWQVIGGWSEAPI